MRCATKSHCCRQNARYSQLGERSPEIGSQPSWTPKTIMSMRASQKSGVAKPTNTKTVVTLSNLEYWRSPRARRSGIASTTMTISSTMFRSKVIGSRSPIF